MKKLLLMTVLMVSAVLNAASGDRCSVITFQIDNAQNQLMEMQSVVRPNARLMSEIVLAEYQVNQLLNQASQLGC